jgi:large subunit ribosomal protein L3
MGNMPIFSLIKIKMKFILGKKIGMSQMFDEKGTLVPVTLMSAGPCFVLQNKGEKDGYNAFQIGLEKIEKKNKIKKSMKGKEFKFIKEFRGKDENLKVGAELNVSIFTPGEKIKISGMSKGKGFQGGVKRHGFKGKLSATHGNKHEHRTIGSTGSRFPQHVIKGRKMPGRMGFERISVKNLKIMKVDKENNLLIVKGAVPGKTGALLEIRA